MAIPRFAHVVLQTGQLERMRDWYAANPVGVGFDPEKMIAARKAGVAERELITMDWARTTSPELPDPLVALTS